MLKYTCYLLWIIQVQQFDYYQLIIVKSESIDIINTLTCAYSLVSFLTSKQFLCHFFPLSLVVVNC